MEIEKKIEFLHKKTNLFPFLTKMDKSLSNRCCIKSINTINPLKNTKLNRIELLSLINETPDYANQTIELYKTTLNLQKKYNLKINNMILDKKDFSSLLTSG